MWRPDSVKWDVFAAYLSKYGVVDDVTLARSPTETAHDDYIINMCVNQVGFQAIPHIIKFKDQNMMAIVEGRRPLCWSCKQFGHFSRSCLQTIKMPNTTAIATTSTTPAATIAITTEKNKTWGPPQQRGVDPGSSKGEETPISQTKHRL